MRYHFLAALAAFLASATSHAAVVTSFGAGSAVTGAPTYQTGFDNIQDGVSLLNYTEDDIVASVDGTQCCFAGGVHYAGGGNYSYVSISTVGGNAFGAMEVDVGSGFGISTHNVAWQTLLNGAATGSGVITVDNIGDSTGFAVLGWADANLFDTLLLGAGPSADDYSQLGQFQAIALNSVKIGNGGAPTNNDVPEPATLSLLGLGMAALVARRRKA